MIISEFTDINQWGQIIEKSFKNPKGVAVFKHSDTCSISQMAFSRLQRNWIYSEAELPFHLIEVKKYRPASNFLAAQLNIQHESPQLFIIKDGACIYNASHGAINVKDVESLY